MSEGTGIQWTEATWNPITGCTKVSQGCKHCYAEREWARLSHAKNSVYFGRKFTDVMMRPERLTQPMKWARQPRMIFVNSMSDLFHESVPFDFIARVWSAMDETPMHTYQILTKRPERAVDFIEWLGEPPLTNVWLGTSIEDQATADERIPWIVQTGAWVRWISAEPLLANVDLSAFLPHADDENPGGSRCLDWVVVGGESGHDKDARPFNVQWARRIVQQCRAAKVPVFVKQLGRFPFSSDDADYTRMPWMHFHKDRYEHPGPPPLALRTMRLPSRKGGDPEQWPEDVRVREFPFAPSTQFAPENSNEPEE
jgi:protein gp37